MLIQTPDGTWIDPLTIDVIQVFGPPGRDGADTHELRVVLSDGRNLVATYPDEDAANAARDRLATAANAAMRIGPED